MEEKEPITTGLEMMQTRRQASTVIEKGPNSLAGKLLTNNFIIDEESNSEKGGQIEESQEELKLEQARGLISYDQISTSQLKGDLHDF